MIYLDYAATTPVNREVLDSFNKANIEFIGNSNSLHKLGVEANKLISSATKQIGNILNVKENEIIYTSGSSEANNLAIKGICLKYQNRGKHIITTKFEHSSVYGPINYLETLGFEISYVRTNEFGLVDINDLKNILRKDTILVSVCGVNSEIGIKQNVEEIGKLLKENSNCFFHVDITQMIGKVHVDLKHIDLASFSAHKIYGLKGIGCLIKKENVLIEPLISGGKSTTEFRSGTPAHPLIVSISKSLRLIMNDLDNNYNYIKNLNEYLKSKLLKYENVYLNSNKYCIPHILNISIKGIKAETFMHSLEKQQIYVSTKTACSDSNSYSTAVNNLTNDLDLAKSSIRISLSHLTTYEDIDRFVEIFDICYKQLMI